MHKQEVEADCRLLHHIVVLGLPPTVFVLCKLLFHGPRQPAAHRQAVHKLLGSTAELEVLSCTAELVVKLKRKSTKCSTFNVIRRRRAD
jgi:hypothetical protein